MSVVGAFNPNSTEARDVLWHLHPNTDAPATNSAARW